jgi:hypothetical protein
LNDEEARRHLPRASFYSHQWRSMFEFRQSRPRLHAVPWTKQASFEQYWS